MSAFFDRVSHEQAIKHRLIHVYHPCTNGHVEHMHRTVKDATIKVFQYPDFAALKADVLAFVTAYKVNRYLKVLRSIQGDR
ncbi:MULTISPECIES: integrase core domain-containing protein [unclassified Pseudomonas]|uniref:integrase core domain-containing protein n=1 Tax=unclassified Pseudomonas TaxID=196821 RepID=UPI0002EE1FDC